MHGEDCGIHQSLPAWNWKRSYGLQQQNGTECLSEGNGKEGRSVDGGSDTNSTIEKEY